MLVICRIVAYIGLFMVVFGLLALAANLILRLLRMQDGNSRLYSNAACLFVFWGIALAFMSAIVTLAIPVWLDR